MGILLTVIAFNNPMEAKWMPKCMFKLATGFDCPSCGATRATYAALHGHFGEALAYNPFLIIGLSYFALTGLVCLIPSLHTSRLRRIVFGKTAGTIYVVLFFLWWIIRNIIRY